MIDIPLAPELQVLRQGRVEYVTDTHPSTSLSNRADTCVVKQIYYTQLIIYYFRFEPAQIVMDYTTHHLLFQI